MAKVRPYTLGQAQQLVADAVLRGAKRHQKWAALERLYVSGSVEALAQQDAAAAKLLDEVLPISTETVNMVLPHTNLLIGSLLDVDPQFGCEPLSFGDGQDDEAELDAALVAEETLKYWFKKMRGSATVADMTADLVKLGPCFGKVTWNTVETEVPRKPEAVAADISELAEAEGLDYDTAAEKVALTETLAVANEPHFERVSPYDIFAEVGAGSVYTARWVAQRLVLPEDEARDMLDLADSVALTPLTDTGVAALAGAGLRALDGEESPFARVELWEFYDMRAKRMLVFQTTSGEALFDGPLPYEHGQVPFVQAVNYRKNGSDFYGFGDLENIAGLQLWLNETFVKQVENLSRTTAKTLIDDSILDDDTQSALEDPETLAIPVNTNGRPLDTLVHHITTPPLPADVYQATGTFQDFMAQVLGLSELQRGLLSAGNRVSGSAAAAIEGHSNVRAVSKQAELSRMLGRFGELLLELCQEFMTEKVAMKVTGIRGTVVARISAANLRGQFRVAVDASTLARVNPAVREQRALEFVNTVLPALARDGYDPEPYWRAKLRDLGENPELLVKLAAPQGAPAAGGPSVPAQAPVPAAGPMPAAGELPALPGLAQDAATEGDVVL